MAGVMRLYVAGPMSGHEDLNFPAFHAAAAALRALGHQVVNPAEINSDPGADWLTCMRADIKQLVDCDGVALLPGWEHSRGAMLERAIAAGLGLRVLLVSELVAELISELVAEASAVATTVAA